MRYDKREADRLIEAMKLQQAVLSAMAGAFIDGRRTRDELPAAVDSYREALTKAIAYTCQQEK